MTCYYTYILFDWLAIPRYVGKGKGRRDEAHEKSSDPVNWMKNEFIERTWIMLGEIPKIRVRDNISEKEAFALERALIKAIGRADLGKGPLTNMTDGGDGASSLTEEQSKRRGRRIADAWTKIPSHVRTEVEVIILILRLVDYSTFQEGSRKWW
jgi:hypothetical protein